MNAEERLSRMGLCALGHLGAPALVRLVEKEGPVDVWSALRAGGDDSMWSRRARSIEPERIVEDTEKAGARFVVPGDAEWPAQLEDLARAEVGKQAGVPFGLWVRGERLPDLSTGVSIVGARAATHYGEHLAIEMAADLAAGGRPIVSGLAFGIDAAAHRGALTAGGVTVAVVASGVDRPYPAGNASIAKMILRSGAIVSELPPGHAPRREGFLARNRIVAALTGGLVVIEAGLRSGAKNSAAWANELERVVMAVPGPVTSSVSATPHQLIRHQQAVLVTDSRDVEALLSPLGAVEEPGKRGDDTAWDRLPEDLKEVREAIESDEEVSAAQLARRLGLAMPVVVAALGELTDKRWLERGEAGGWRLPSRPMLVDS